MNSLLLDTNFSSLPIYEHLVRLKHNVFLIGSNNNDFLARNIATHISADYSSLDNLRKVINQFNIRYIIPGCNDISYQACSDFSEEIFSNNIDCTENTQTLINKSKFKYFAESNGLSVPRKYSIDQILGAKYFPSIIIKPADSFSGKGINRVCKNNSHDFEAAIEKAKSTSKNSDYIIEEHIKGQLYSHSAFLQKGKIQLDFFVEERCFANEFAVDTSFVSHELNPYIIQQTRDQISLIAEKLKLRDGLIHTQFIVTPDNKISLIEVTRRCPGDLYSQLIKFSTGFDYAATYTDFFIKESYRENLSDFEKNNSTVIRHTITNTQEGIFKSINFKKNIRILDYIQLASVGDYIKSAPTGRIGILFIKCQNDQERKDIIKDIAEKKLYCINYLGD